jgi:hypothetical protein
MEHWDLHTLEVERRQPRILHSARGEARSILIALAAGAIGGPGLAAVFEPAERHAVRALTDARLLLVLAPWPGEGHPGARDD